MGPGYQELKSRSSDTRSFSFSRASLYKSLDHNSKHLKISWGFYYLENASNFRNGFAGVNGKLREEKNSESE